jgi:selenocysteine lyase/cysteine desulfurase
MDPAHLVAPRAHQKRGGTLIFHFGERHSAVTECLEHNNVQFDGRAKGIRLSPHLCNSTAQISEIIDLVNSSLGAD